MPEVRKHERSNKDQLGQFFTPEYLAWDLIDGITVTKETRILEPGCGNGSFVIPLLRKLCKLYGGKRIDRLVKVLENNIWSVEIDPHVFNSLLDRIYKFYGITPADLSNIRHNLRCANFLLHDFKDVKFDYIIGNPPFGGTIDLEHQDKIDRMFGRRNGLKIKKESYSFFTVKSLDLLKDGGKIRFICSDTFLTIKTMSGLRHFLMDNGITKVSRLDEFSSETKYPMVIIDYCKSGRADYISLDGNNIDRGNMELTGNFSWTVDSYASRYFNGPKISDFMICLSGMTTGKNELFVRDIVDGKIREDYDFEYFDDPITLKRELEHARLNKLSPEKQQEIAEQEMAGATRRNIRFVKKNESVFILLPNPDYCYYNKANYEILYTPPFHAIYWKDDGDAVFTFKKNGNWYLHGVGGKKYFGKEGITWGMISSKMRMRYLPPGYILDCGAPCGFLKENIDKDELYFILGWCLTDLANELLKKYINHTRNIQGKDVERLPYPSWVKTDKKGSAVELVKNLVEMSKMGKLEESIVLEKLNDKYAW